MVRRRELLALNFYKKSPFFGSIKNMNYKIERMNIEDEGDYFKVTYWPGPYNFAKTSDTLKQTAIFPFSEEGICSVADFLNEQFEKQSELWNL